ncbi:hypothetical protein SBC2_82810 (plasmid) [Caballeronia sp. SBC2]|nr:hypothetical protein SBC2_82810 [Caballeronia sp. SBC2]
MKRFVQGDNRTQSFLLPEALDDYVTDTNPVRVVDVFVDELDLQKLGFEGSKTSTIEAFKVLLCGSHDFSLSVFIVQRATTLGAQRR